MKAVSKFLFATIAISLLASCASYNLSNKSNNEELILKVKENPQTFDQLALPVQGSNRGVIELATSALSLGTDLVKKAIDKEKAKYAKEYNLSFGHNYFYKDISRVSAMDPRGLQFEGVEILRLFEEDGKTDTALYILLELDTSRPADFVNNSFFKLKAKEVKINYTKVKIPDSRWYMPWTWYYKGDKRKKINLDLELIVKATWISDDAEVKSDVQIGAFNFFLRDVVPGETYAPEITGYSFMIPRSAGYYKNPQNKIEQCYGRGMYTLSAKITEGWNTDFITTTVQANSPQYLDDLSNMLQNQLK